jgi:hypothetical protein
MKGNVIADGEIIAKEEKYTEFFFYKSPPEPAGQFQSNLVQIILG